MACCGFTHRSATCWAATTHPPLLLSQHCRCCSSPPAGAVYPAAGALDKEKGRLLAKPFGPATSWHITYNSTGITVVVATAQGSYQVGKQTPGRQTGGRGRSQAGSQSCSSSGPRQLLANCASTPCFCLGLVLSCSPHGP